MLKQKILGHGHGQARKNHTQCLGVGLGGWNLLRTDHGKAIDAIDAQSLSQAGDVSASCLPIAGLFFSHISHEKTVKSYL